MQATSVRPTSAPPPTEEQLRLAYRHLYRPGWPTTFEAAMASHTHSICITGRARDLRRASFCNAVPRHGLPCGPVPPTPTEPPNALAAGRRSLNSLAKAAPRTPSARLKPSGVDLKRLAANDKDD